ncbi:hypothetical protein FQR65_LT01486 [Abscondita terminalis]|nr:hypothetical protein FQR65_LT01486 [Abscondita terminalis]
MEVTNINFYELIPEIKEAINKCDFIAIDCELTGLNTGNDINAFDTQKQYYEKLRKNSKNFLIIQYGLCMFRYDADENAYKQQGYNFYIFPKSGNKHVPDHRFLCQTSCIDFLINCGFDFNKLFKEGIPYLNSIEEEKYKVTLSDAQKIRIHQIQNNFSPETKNNIISMTAEERIFVDNVFKEIEEFIVGDEDERVLPKCNAYVRRLIYQEAQKTLVNKATLETRVLENKDRILVVTRLKSKSTQEEEHRMTVEKEEEEFRKNIGFSLIVKMIIESEKLVVGHNMCLDLLHTIDQFLTPLPYDYDEFKELAHFSFSKVLDTKFMSSIAPLKAVIDSNVLTHLLNIVKEEPFEIPDIEIEDNKEGYCLRRNKSHEAGYDAFITGVCFLAMWNYLHKAETSSNSFPDVSLLSPYINRVYLMRLQDSPYIHLGGTDPTPSRDHVVHLTFPKTWKLNDIIQLFSPFGNIYVSWIDDHSAFVSLQKRDQISIALSTLSQSDAYQIMTYAQYQTQLVTPNPIPSTPYSFCQKKRTAENNHTTMKKRKRSFGEGVSQKKYDEGKVTTPLKVSPKKVQQTFAESSWD